MNAASYAIEVKDLTKKFDGKTVVDHISLRVPKGKIYGFLGPNGSGKTTTIRMICGLLTPDDGEGTCLGMDVRTEAEEIKKHVGYMTQKFSFWEDLTIRENLRFAADMFNMDNVKERVEKALENLNLTDRADQLAGSLSGGWKQRLALAACILHEPEILLLDEPTAGVDPKARREFWDEIHRLSEEGLTVLVSTHYMDEAERCHAIIYIAYGHIMAEGTIEDVISKTGLKTWIASGSNLTPLVTALQGNPSIETTALFGNDLHISGEDSTKLEKALAPYKQQYKWEEAETSLEDAFIYYMTKAEEKEKEKSQK